MAETKTDRRKSKAPEAKAKAPQAKGKEGLKRGIEGCKRAYQAKGYCFFHYDKWKNGELPKARYKTCSKEGCHKKVVAHGLCAEHQKNKTGEAAVAAAPAAPPAPPAAPA
ncbi:MAG TPA: hypothetical protein VKH65_17080 [Myxococcales bacterium]|nr:hypothetical protein [Myxococcales bacterium]